MIKAKIGSNFKNDKDKNIYSLFILSDNESCKFTERRCNSECNCFSDYRNKCISADVDTHITILDNIENYDNINENTLINFYSSYSYDELIEKIDKYNKNNFNEK